LPPFCLTPRKSVDERAAEVSRRLDKQPLKGSDKEAAAQLRGLIREVSDEKPDWRDLPAIGAASMVNYAAAPVGGAVYDSNWLASNTAVR